MNKLLKSYRNKSNEKGFTLIELMIVVAIIGILAAIAIPNFLGMQEKAKRRAIEEGVSSAKSEIHSWMTASLKGELGVVDYDGDGVVGATEAPVATLGDVATVWRNAFFTKRGGTVWSPWNSTKEIFTIGPVVGTGQIGLSLVNQGRGIVLIGVDVNGNTLLRDTVSVD